MTTHLLKLSEFILQLLVRPQLWQYDGMGYCPSCNSRSMFVYSKETEHTLLRIMSTWAVCDNFKKKLLIRENFLCCSCGANFRMRAHAETVLKLLGMSSYRQLAQRLHKHHGFRMYETAGHGIFRDNTIKKAAGYVASEYFENQPFGVYSTALRNENLECLTFPDNTFDLVINSDVLEHVGNLHEALLEIKRVLKPGGLHVFTVPANDELLQTTERIRFANGAAVYLLKPEVHGDPLRKEGSLVFRDFGKDTLPYLSLEGLECKQVDYFKNGTFIMSVYYSQKS